VHIEEIINFLSEVNPLIVYFVIFGISFIENIFPPSPSDVVVLFGGSMVAVGKANFLLTLLAASSGSMFGFVTMYFIGKWFGRKFLDSGRMKFISPASIQKVEIWFRKYSYAIIIANRFLAGTRAVVSFFAGMSEINLKITTILSFIIALLWYFILIYSGYQMGINWQSIISYLQTYWMVISAILILMLLIWLVKYFLTRKKNPPNA
jgi:membrane protein DedA with SNARE-associated domain